MSRFTFKGKADKFNPNCTSTLLFDNKDGSTERIFCEQTTCVDSHYVPTGVITTCRTQLLPAGHTNEKFTWGLEGGPWTSSATSSGYISSPNEFVGAGSTFSKPAPITDPSGCGWKFVTNPDGSNWRWIINPGFFSNVWAIQETSNAGYGPSNSLNGATIDPAKAIGVNLFEPANTYDSDFGNFLGCGVQKTVYEVPEITYFDVGSRLIPDSHIVEFPDALIPLTPPYNVQGYHEFPDFEETQEYHNNYIKPAAGGPGKCGMSYDPLHHPGPDISTISRAFTYTGVSPYTSNLGAKSYYPLKDNDALPGNTVKRGVRTDTVLHTGYRMQKYVQKKHRVTFTKTQSTIQFGLRDIETRMYNLGYQARWEFVSVTPKIVYATLCPSCSPDWRYATYSFQAKASVFIRVYYEPLTNTAYEYGPYRKDVSTEIQPGRLRPYNPPVAYSESNSNNGDALNPPWQGWLWEIGLNPFNYNPAQNPPPDINLGSHYIMTYNVIGGKHRWGFVSSHTSSALPDNLSDIRDPKRLKTLLYYVNKMNWRTPPNTTYSMITSQYAKSVVDPTYISFGGQNFSRLGNTWHPPMIGSFARATGTLPLSPDNFKIFRRKILDDSINTINSQPIRLSYSAKREWFNGTCPFNLNFDYNKSSHVYIKNECSNILVPYIEPSGE